MSVKTILGLIILKNQSFEGLVLLPYSKEIIVNKL